MSGAEPTTLDAVAAFFANGGPLQKSLAEFESRPEQTRLAVQIAEALAVGENLIAEAGTGTGKTLAYLVPALASGRRVVVSTATKHLQDQLLHDELPGLERAAGRTFDVQLLKGRASYLCEARAATFAPNVLLPGFESDERGDDTEHWQQINAWRAETQSGDRSEVAGVPHDAAIWRRLTLGSDQCGGRTCGLYERCWVTQARRRAQEASLVVTNHHLYMSDLVVRARLDGSAAVLPPHDLVIFDEAHELEDIAAQHFGRSVSERRLHEVAREVGQALARRGALDKTGARLLGEIDLAARRLFDRLPYGDGRARLGARRDTYAKEVEHLESLVATLPTLLEHADAPESERLLRWRATSVTDDLGAILGAEAAAAAEREARRAPRGEDHDASQAAEATDPTDMQAPALPTYVRYAERHGRHRAVVARPLEVAPLLKSALVDRQVVCVSATLAIGGSFSHSRARLGIDLPREMVVASPFDYPSQAKLYVAQDLPEPDAPEFSAAVGARAAELVGAAGGGAFVLCTSRRMLEIVGKALRSAPPTRGLTVLVQDEAPRHDQLRTFASDGNAVLVATMGFWRGVDVPGQALRLVIIDKLPFASPGDPVVAAQLEWHTRRGEHPFSRFQLPHATLLLRQGFGRLIRRRSDRGMVAILDRRIITRSYGRAMLSSLPRCDVITEQAAAVLHLQHLPRPEALVHATVDAKKKRARRKRRRAGETTPS